MDALLGDPGGSSGPGIRLRICDQPRGFPDHGPDNCCTCGPSALVLLLDAGRIVDRLGHQGDGDLSGE